MEYPDSCSTIMKHVAREVAAVEGGLVWFRGGFTMGTLFPDRWTCIWQESRVPQLDSNNRFHVLTKMEVGTSDSEETKKKEVKVRKTKEDKSLREITVKIGLERIDIQEGIMVEVLLDSGTTGLVMSLEFVRKQGFKLKKINRPIYIRNVDSSFN